MSAKQTACDVFVAGGGPAGLAAAIALRQRGADVLVADALEPPIDKACGEGLMPDSRHDLAQLGVELHRSHGAEFSGIQFCDQRSTVSADFPSGTGLGVRRLTLHRLLIERALEAGVRLLWRTPVAVNPGEPVSIGGEPVPYRYLIGADGQSSRVRTWAGLDRGKLLTRRFGFRVHYRLPRPYWGRCVEVHWGPLGQAYVTPTAEDEICISIMTRKPDPENSPRQSRSQAVIDGIPTLSEKLIGAEIISRELGALTTTRRLKRVVRGNVALIGDASGSVDAITGEGLAMGFRQAPLLADAIVHNNLAHYQAGHPAILRLPQSMARMLLLMDRSRELRERALHAFAAEPSLFEKMLRVHVGEDAMERFAWRYAPRLGLRMLLPA